MTHKEAKAERDKLNAKNPKQRYYIVPEDHKKYLAFMEDFRRMGDDANDESVRIYTKDPNGFRVIPIQVEHTGKDTSHLQDES